MVEESREARRSQTSLSAAAEDNGVLSPVAPL